MVWKNFVIKKLKTLAYAIEDFNVEEFFGTFYKKDCKK